MEGEGAGFDAPDDGAAADRGRLRIASLAKALGACVIDDSGVGEGSFAERQLVRN